MPHLSTPGHCRIDTCPITLTKPTCLPQALPAVIDEVDMDAGSDGEGGARGEGVNGGGSANGAGAGRSGAAKRGSAANSDSGSDNDEEAVALLGSASSRCAPM